MKVILFLGNSNGKGENINRKHEKGVETAVTRRFKQGNTKV